MKLILPNEDIAKILNYLKAHNEPDDNACAFVCVNHDNLTCLVRDWIEKKVKEYRETFKTPRAAAVRAIVNANANRWDEAQLILNHEEIKDEHVNVVVLIGYRQDELDSEADYIRDFAKGAPHWIEDLEVLTLVVDPMKPIIK